MGAVLSHFNCVQLVVTPLTVAHQAPLSMGFSRQESWMVCHAFLQGIFLTQGLSLCLLCFLNWPKDSLSLVPPGKPLSLFRWVYFGVLYAMPLICLFFQWNATVVVTVLNYYKWFSVSPKVGLCQSSDFVLFLQCCVGYCGLLPLCKILESVCWYPPNNVQGLVLFSTWRSSWKELTSCQYRVFLSIDIEYCTIYLVTLISFIIIIWFSICRLYTYFIRLTPRYFIL